MNLEKFGSVKSLEEIKYTDIFIATLSASERFYGAKGYKINTDDTKSDYIVVLGPSQDPSGQASSPFIYHPSVMNSRPVLDLHTQLQLIPSMRLKYAKTLFDGQAGRGCLVLVKDKILLDLGSSASGVRQYFNLESGEIIEGFSGPNVFIITSWTLQTTDPLKPEILLSFPDEICRS